GKVALQRLLRHVIQSREQRVGEYDCAGAHLVVTLVVAEKEQLVFLDGSTHAESVLSANEKGIRIKGISPQRRVGRHIVIAEEKEAAAVKLIGARAGDDVDGPGRDG